MLNNLSSFFYANRSKVLLLGIALFLVAGGATLFALTSIDPSSASLDSADSVPKGTPLDALPEETVPNVRTSREAQSSTYTVQSTPYGGGADFNHADFSSIGFCVDYTASAPDVSDVYELTTASAVGLSAATEANVSAALAALSDPSLTSSYSLLDLQIGVQKAVWKFTDNRSVSGLSQTIYDRVIAGTYQPQAVQWLHNNGADQPLVILPSMSDYGDAPATYGDAWATIDDELYLGSFIDSETGSQYSADANGDDITDSSDEDGVTFVGGIGLPGSTGNQIDISLFHGLDVPGHTYSALSVWIDFDGNGTFDPSEKIVADQQVTESASQQNLTFTYDVPINATPGDTYARVRLDADGGMDPVGIAAGNLGEVEDYKVTIASPSSCRVVDPNSHGLSAGNFVETSFPGVTISTGDNNHRPMIFDSSNPTGGDTDLGTPHTDFGGPGVGGGGASGTPGQNSFGVGNLIIISEDNNQANPDDNGGGGTLTYVFTNPQTITYIDFVDADEASIPSIVLYDAANGVLGTFNGVALGDNSYQRFNIEDAVAGLGIANVSKIDISFPGSGAVGVIGNCSVSVGSTVFADTNNDGEQNNGEIGIPNVTLNLYRPGPDGEIGGTDDQLVAVDTTDGSGNYLFDSLDEGSYYIVIPTPPTNAPTSSTSVDRDDNQQDGDNNGLQSNGSGSSVTSPIIELLIDGEPTGGTESNQAGTQDDADDANGDMTVDFGFIPNIVSPAVIGDYVWYDTDADGIQDAGEPGIGNVTLDLYLDDGDGICEPNGDDTLIDTTVTNADGSYLFTVAPGDYCVDVTDTNNKLAGLTHSTGSQSVTDPSPVVTLAAGDSNLYQDFGYYQPISTPSKALIGDTIWYDDGDGIQEPGEQGISGVVVNIIDSNGTVIALAITDENGNYLVEVPAGTYTVVVDTNTLPTGLAQSGDPDGLLDNMTTIYVGPGETNLTADFGYTDTGDTLGSIGNQIWIDNGNGTFEPATENGIPGVSVNLVRDTNGNGVADDGEPVIATVYTNENGEYLFDAVPAGDYVVQVSDTSNVLRDYNSVTGPNPGSDNNAQGGDYAVDLAEGEDNTTADFGYVANGGTDIGVIGNTVWYETDKDGLYEAGELGLAGVTVELRDGSGGFIAKTTTAGTGKYAFTGLPAGNYQVVVTDEYGILDAFEVTTLGANPGNDNNNQAQAYAINLPQGGINLTADFGYTDTPPVAIGDYVWYDTDADGIQDAGEPGIGNVTIDLYQDTDGDGICEPGGDDTLVDSTVTNADGSYLFTVAPGSYCVDVTDTNGELTGLTHTTGSQSVTDPSPVVTLAAGESDLDQDFGYYQPLGDPNNALIGDTIWFDDGDGIQEPGEMGIPGVTVEIRDTNGNVITTVVTDENGNYLAEVPAGTYIIVVDPSTLPAGLTQSGDPDSTLDNQTTITVGPGETDLTGDFGYTDTGNTLGSIGSQIWVDDGDGTFEPATEQGIPGVGVNLIRDTNGNGIADDGEPVIATIYTDENGAYLFDALPAGDYVVTVSDTSNVLRDYDSVVGPNIGDDNNAQGGEYPVSLTAGEDNTTADFGYVSNGNNNIGVIGNTVWFETDQDGLYEAGELGLAGVTVELRNGNGDFIAKTTTAGSGKYAFTGLPAGNYQVVVTDELGILSAFAATELGATPGADHNNQAQAYAIALPQGGINMTADFGYTTQPLSIGNYIWADDNNNGIQDEGASFGIPDAPVQLFRDTNGNGEMDENDVMVDSTTTDETGFYRFDGLTPDTYFVVIPVTALFGPTSIPELRAGPADQFGGGDIANDNNGFVVPTNPLLGVVSGPIELIGDEPAENGTYNDTVDFGFKSLDPTAVALIGARVVVGSNIGLISAVLLASILMAGTAIVIRRQS